jgi:hypothetical protein
MGTACPFADALVRVNFRFLKEMPMRTAHIVEVTGRRRAVAALAAVLDGILLVGMWAFVPPAVVALAVMILVFFAADGVWRLVQAAGRAWESRMRGEPVARHQHLI